MENPDRMVAEAFRVLRPGGRLVLSNMTPHAAQETALYEWFPDTLTSDLAAHPSPEALQKFARDAGFFDVRCEIRVVGGSVPLSRVAEKYAEKNSCSQLNALPIAVYEANYGRLRAAANEDPEEMAVDEAALIHLVANRP